MRLSRRVLIFSILAWLFALFVAIDCIPIAAKYGVWEICVFAWSLVIVPPVLLGRLLMRFDKLGCFFVMDFYVLLLWLTHAFRTGSWCDMFLGLAAFVLLISIVPYAAFKIRAKRIS